MRIVMVSSDTATMSVLLASDTLTPDNKLFNRATNVFDWQTIMADPSTDVTMSGNLKVDWNMTSHVRQAARILSIAE